MENASQNSKERNNKRHVLLKRETGGWANLGSEGSDWSWSGEGERDEVVNDDSESARRVSFSSSLELRLSVVCSVFTDMVVKELVAVVGVWFNRSLIHERSSHWQQSSRSTLSNIFTRVLDQLVSERYKALRACSCMLLHPSHPFFRPSELIKSGTENILH